MANNYIPCPPTNPCDCIGITHVTDPQPCDPKKPKDKNCLKLCDIVVLSKDGVGPCGQTGTLNLNNYPHTIEVCKGVALKWKVKYFDDKIFVTATSTREGILSWVTKGPETVKKYGKVIVEACCGEFSDYGNVLIGIKDECQCPDCPDCDNCDPCTGNCLDYVVNPSVQSMINETSNYVENADS